MIKETIEETVITNNLSSKYISWSATIVSALVLIGLSFLLYLLTIGLGLSAFTLDRNGQISLAIGGLIWLIVTSYFVAFLSGWIAGLLTRTYNFANSYSGILHGFSAWCLALIITVALFSQSLTAALGSPAYYSINKPTDITQNNLTSTSMENTGYFSAEENINKFGVGVLAIFFIFLSGALGNSIGGYLGSNYHSPKPR